jgi:hypothetical protein
MPIYQFAHPEHPIVIDVVQSMKEPHVYVDSKGVEWVRIWSVPQASFDTKIDPYNKKSYMNKDHGKRTLGELWDESNDFSRKRAEKNGGLDPVKEKYEQEYSKKRRGKRHKEA